MDTDTGTATATSWPLYKDASDRHFEQPGIHAGDSAETCCDVYWLAPVPRLPGSDRLPQPCVQMPLRVCTADKADADVYQGASWV